MPLLRLDRFLPARRYKAPIASAQSLLYMTFSIFFSHQQDVMLHISQVTRCSQTLVLKEELP